MMMMEPEQPRPPQSLLKPSTSSASAAFPPPSSSSFRKRSTSGGGGGPLLMGQSSSVTKLEEKGGEEEEDPTMALSTSGDAQDIMRDNLDIMREIVMRIRTDPDFAASIYADCPRLQHQLEQRPDLRPIFEDPNLVRINFEQVYREAGGKLPEDEIKEEETAFSRRKKSFRVVLAKIVNHPLFKVLRALLLIKKIVGCITGGGVSMVRGFFQNMCCSPDALAAGADVDADGNGNAPDTEPTSSNQETKAALNKVAEHMEDPEVQAQMQELLENDPEALEEAIANDPELSALRDSNPLCAELMKDPETMRILVEPENLRALGECPDLIEQDFADPNWSPPDVEAGGDVEQDEVEVDLDEEEEVNVDEEEEEEEENMLEEYELGDTEDGQEAANNRGGGGGGNKSQAKSQNNQGGRAGFMASVGAGFTDMIAAQVVGVSVGEFMPGMGGGEDDLGLGEVEGAADGAAESADQAASGAETAATNATAVASALEGANAVMGDSFGDQLDTLERGMDDLEDHTEAYDDNADSNNATAQASSQGQPGAAATGMAVAEGAVLGTFLMGGVADDKKKEQDRNGVVMAEDEPDTEEEKEKKSRFGWFGDLGSALATAAKESLAGAVLGDDLGEMLVEKNEERNKSKSDLNTSRSDLNGSKSSTMGDNSEKSSKGNLFKR